MLQFLLNRSLCPPYQNNDLNKKFHGFKESPIELYIKPAIVEKEKARGIPQPTPPADVIPRFNVCRANDFGFSLPDNPVVTPVYCSQAGQAARNPTLFVRWVGIPKAEESVARQFQDMLNPQLAGILTVGMYNQQGAKLWKSPDGLGDSWHPMDSVTTRLLNKLYC
ncbi:hypothetical protein [Candidatus Berkiella aquae]|uniref:Uncharacterized protein n=1 Tax=Candidatus Berkiella aquae TaxID=295108 RepID=A0A0Q9YB65_9GAMM|nr:hypothetical protein [Candidatus Berkiella aquae]MCS5710630.1 hypothetical protein [Candidatus Berkiella aquae]